MVPFPMPCTPQHMRGKSGSIFHCSLFQGARNHAMGHSDQAVPMVPRTILDVNGRNDHLQTHRLEPLRLRGFIVFSLFSILSFFFVCF